MLQILAIDPGPTESGWVRMDGTGTVIDSGHDANAEVDDLVLAFSKSSLYSILAIEGICSYGRAIGNDVFHTLLWIGHFCRSFRMEGFKSISVVMKTKPQIAHILTGSPNASGTAVKNAIFHGYMKKLNLATEKLVKGTNKHPGPLAGITDHKFSALTVGIAALSEFRKGDWWKDYGIK
jgi:hypothetical protein